MHLITARACYQLIRSGECYHVMRDGRTLGDVCPCACALDGGDVLWTPGLTRSPRSAARVLVKGKA